MKWRAAESWVFPLGPHTDSDSGLQYKYGNSKSTRDTWGETELTGLRVRAGKEGVKAVLSGD